MSPPDPTPPIDLQFLPSWLKETPGKNPYEHVRGDEESATRERRGGREQRPDRRNAAGRGAPKPGREQPRKPRPGGDRGRESKPQREPRASHRPPDRDQPRLHGPAQVDVEFLPDEKCLASVAAEIKSTHHAYAVFALGRMFLQQPARYAVRLAVREGAPALYRLGEDGPVATSAEALEHAGFSSMSERFYKREAVELEAPKGNFANVARCKLSGTLLGPTNHHGYQPALRGLFERRFSRRMSFQEYSAHNVEIVSDPELVEKWKEDSRRRVTWTPLAEGGPAAFESESDARDHFRKTHFPALVHEVREALVSGPESVRIRDRALAASIREAWHTETKFPVRLVRHLTASFADQGLHLFKHRKRFLYVSSVRPVLFKGDVSAARESVRQILAVLAAEPGIARKTLAERLLPDVPAAELPAARLALAADLHWLILAGHVIEFQDGKLDLPLTHKPQAEPTASTAPSEPEPLAPPATAADESVS